MRLGGGHTGIPPCVAPAFFSESLEGAQCEGFSNALLGAREDSESPRCCEFEDVPSIEHAATHFGELQDMVLLRWGSPKRGTKPQGTLPVRLPTNIVHLHPSTKTPW